MILRNSKLILMTLSLLLLIIIATIIFAVYDIRAKNKETSILLNEADHVSEVRNLFQSIRTAQNNAKEDLADFNNLLLSSDYLISLIEDIERAGRTLGLETSIISVGKVEAKESPQSDMINIVMETQGSWAPTLSFLRTIESLPYRVMISESGLSKVDSSWRLRVILSLYLFD